MFTPVKIHSPNLPSKLPAVEIGVYPFRDSCEFKVNMIHFLVTPGYEYCFAALVGANLCPRPLPVRLWTYSGLFSMERLPAGSWVFSDLERLAVWELRLAGEIARLIREAGPEAGFTLYNDPARAACRYELLLRLHQAGLNRFRAWRAEDGLPQARFPVFLRLESNHRWPLTDLIHSPAELERELEGLAAQGISRRGVLIIEYEAEPFAPNVWRKYAAYRIGDRIVADHIVHDVSWLAKFGHDDAWSDAVMVDEANWVRDNPHAAMLMRAFDIARIDYGRVDYGMVGGVPQIWEINTNPQLPVPRLEKMAPGRHAAALHSRDLRLDAIEALDNKRGGQPLALDSEPLTRHRARQNPNRADIIRD
jgi:hypothetical protein